LDDPSRYRPDPAARRIELEPTSSGLRAVAARVEGLPPARFTVDTGAGDTVTLSGNYTGDNRLLEGRSRRSQRRQGGVGGIKLYTVATLKSFSLGGLHVRRGAGLVRDRP